MLEHVEMMARAAEPVAQVADEPDRLADMVRAAIENLRPVLRRDGGDMTLVGIENDLVVIDLKGACVGCALAVVTVAGIRKQICDAVGRNLRVVPLSALPTAMRRRFVS